MRSCHPAGPHSAFPQPKTDLRLSYLMFAAAAGIHYPCSMSFSAFGQFPTCGPRRLRQSAALRDLVRETSLHAGQLVLPLFARAGRKVRRPVASMPGVFQLSPDEIVRE